MRFFNFVKLLVFVFWFQVLGLLTFLSFCFFGRWFLLETQKNEKRKKTKNKNRKTGWWVGCWVGWVLGRMLVGWVGCWVVGLDVPFPLLGGVVFPLSSVGWCCKASSDNRWCCFSPPLGGAAFTLAPLGRHPTLLALTLRVVSDFRLSRVVGCSESSETLGGFGLYVV